MFGRRKEDKRRTHTGSGLSQVRNNNMLNLKTLNN
jgi:hypothetical protein